MNANETPVLELAKASKELANSLNTQQISSYNTGEMNTNFKERSGRCPAFLFRKNVKIRLTLHHVCGWYTIWVLADWLS
jgi:hypothetical protein